LKIAIKVLAEGMAVAAAAAKADQKNESSSSKSIIMATKKNAKKKRRRVSKHILNSAKTRAAGGGASTLSQDDDGRGTNRDGPPVATAAATAKKQQQRSKNNKHVKDPKEAMAYLEQWKVSRGLDWKFNKNTQSWLIRHMYDAALVSKHTFEVLLEYLQDCHADAKKRLCMDATQRAVRYQRHTEKNDGGDDKNRSHDDDAAPAVDVRADDSYQQRDEHDKRKEYKRARKLLDALQQKQPASSEQSL
jgi:hypothetical protein